MLHICLLQFPTRMDSFSGSRFSFTMLISKKKGLSNWYKLVSYSNSITQCRHLAPHSSLSVLYRRRPTCFLREMSRHYCCLPARSSKQEHPMVPRCRWWDYERARRHAIGGGAVYCGVMAIGGGAVHCAWCGKEKTNNTTNRAYSNLDAPSISFSSIINLVIIPN